MISTQAYDLNRNVLIANVKRDNVEHFLDGSARLYYLGKHVPKVLSLNMLHYFVPYIGKQCGQPYSGIRDLYLIRKVRSGCRREGEADKDASDERIVLELQFVARLFPEYRKQKLLIAHTFTSTTLSELLVQHQAIAPAEPAPRMEPKESIVNNIQININMDNKEKWLDILGKGGIVVNGDLVVGDKVQHKVEKVEAGGIGFQISSAEVPRLTASEQEVREAIGQLQEAKDDQGNYLMHDLDQWYAVFRVLSHYCGYPSLPKDFAHTMQNIGADGMRLPCKYESFRKVALHKLPQNVELWKQYLNVADQYSLKQIKVALKLTEILGVA